MKTKACSIKENNDILDFIKIFKCCPKKKNQFKVMKNFMPLWKENICKSHILTKNLYLSYIKYSQNLRIRKKRFKADKNAL